jgi:hypothetical protein
VRLVSCSGYGSAFESNQGFPWFEAMQSRIAVEDRHFRHRLDVEGQYIFVCICEPCKPHSLPFPKLKSHMAKVHGLRLPARFLKPSCPWFDSKTGPSPRKVRPKKKKRTTKADVDDGSWARLRGIVHARWKQAKARKKRSLMKSYMQVDAGNQQPAVPAKSLYIRLLKVYFCHGSDAGWAGLLDADRWEGVNDSVKKSESTDVLHLWVQALKETLKGAGRSKKLESLLVDSALLQAIFPRAGCVAVEDGLHVIRREVISYACKYLEAQRSLQQWRKGDKIFDFQGAVEDYEKWKSKGKQKTITTLKKNVVENHMARGMGRAEAREEVRCPYTTRMGWSFFLLSLFDEFPHIC